MRLSKDVIAIDLYAVLGVPRIASAEQIRRAYRIQAMTSHPDLHGCDAEQRMVELNVAACVLLDQARRTAYDQARGATVPPAPRQVPPEPFYPWATAAEERDTSWVSERPSPPGRGLDREAQRAVGQWRDGPGRTFAAVADWSADWPAGTHLLVCFSAICVAMLLIASARPRSLPGFERNQPLACAADAITDG